MVQAGIGGWPGLREMTATLAKMGIRRTFPAFSASLFAGGGAMRCFPCKRLVRYIAERRAYYEGAREDIDVLNLFACFIVSLSALVLFSAYVFLAFVPGTPWRISVFDVASIAIMFAVSAIVVSANRRAATHLATFLSALTAMAVFFSSILVDVPGNPGTTSVFVPVVCVALPALFILPPRIGVSTMLAASLVYLMATFAIKDFSNSSQDAVRLMFALGCAVLVREVVMRCRVRHFETGMLYQASSTHDALSRLLNKQGAFDAIQKCLEKADPSVSCALAVVDIDEFKSVNDELGHLVGDMAIRRVGEALRASVEEHDVVGRFGGDEFVVFLYGADEARLRHVFGSSKTMVSSTIEIETGRKIACSVGAVLGKGIEFDLIDAFVQADKALYVAKKSGKNRMVVIPYVPETGGGEDRQTSSYLHRLFGPETGLLSFSDEATPERDSAREIRPDRERIAEGGPACARASEDPQGGMASGERRADVVAERFADGSDAAFGKGAEGSSLADGAVRGDVADTVLIVDDEEINRAILGNLLFDLYEVEEAEDGKEAISKVLTNPRKYCAVLLDVMMGGLDGLETLGCLKRAGLTAVVPVFIITADASDRVTKEAYELGAIDVIGKPIVPYVVRRRIESVAELFRVRARLGYVVEGQQAELTRQTERIVELTRGMVEALSTAIEFRDGDSGNHVHRIYDITKLMLLKTDLGDGLSVEDIDSIALAAIMHDVGKIAIPDSILNKPGKLTPEEFDVMKTHTVQGEKLLSSIPQLKTSKVYEYALDIARHHHERWDGSGYPDGLSGEDISQWAQTVALADVYDALTNKRRYKEAYSHETAVRMILEGECGAFNPDILERFSAIAPDIAKLNNVTKNKEDQR